MRDITTRLERLVSALRGIDGVVVTRAVLRPPRATGAELARMPPDWQALYQACDGLELRWRHPRSGRDGKWFHGGEPTRPDDQDVWELDHDISGLIDLQPARVVLDGGPYWERFTAALGPELEHHHLRPFDLYSASRHVFVDSRTWELRHSEGYHKTFSGRLSLELYLERLFASAGHTDRDRVFAGRHLTGLDSASAKELLADDWVPPRQNDDPRQLAALELGAGRGVAGWRVARERLASAANDSQRRAAVLRETTEGLVGVIDAHPAEHQAFVELLASMWGEQALTHAARGLALSSLARSPVLADLDLDPLVPRLGPGFAAIALLELFSHHPRYHGLVQRELPGLRATLDVAYDENVIEPIARRVGLTLPPRAPAPPREAPRLLHPDPRVAEVLERIRRDRQALGPVLLAVFAEGGPIAVTTAEAVVRCRPAAELIATGRQLKREVHTAWGRLALATVFLGAGSRKLGRALLEQVELSSPELAAAAERLAREHRLERV